MQNNESIYLESASVTDRGLSNKRPQNEDSILELPNVGLFVVADGVGGAQAGDVASQMATEMIGEAFINQPADADAEERLRLAIDRANSAIFQMAKDLPQLASMATTVVALKIAGDSAIVGHVGDSRLYRIDKGGKLFRETADHSVVEEEVRAGRLSEDEALTHPNRNIISRALGAEPAVEPDVKKINIEPGTSFLLCTDGITRHITDRELAETIHRESDPKTAVEALKEICFQRGAEDNLSAIIVRAKPEVAETSVFEIDDVVAPDEDEQIEVEEETIATARPAASSASAAFAAIAVEKEEPIDDESYLSDDLTFEPQEEARPADAGSYSSSSILMPAQTQPAAAAPFDYSYANEGLAIDRRRGRNRILAPVIAFVLGAGATLGLVYLNQTPQPAPPEPQPVLIEKSPDIPLTAFENARRLVDQDPINYLNANAASLQTAQDYYLFGRASMLAGKYWEAKQAFIQARNQLANVDPRNAKVIANEISMGLALIETPGATEAFAKQTALDQAGKSNANTGNVNSLAR